MFSKTKLAVLALLVSESVGVELPPSGKAVTITQMPYFQNSRACVQKCVWYGNQPQGMDTDEAPIQTLHRSY